MFTVYCHGHGGDVLIWPSSITRVVNIRPGVMQVLYRCHCGTRGAIRTGNAA